MLKLLPIQGTLTITILLDWLGQQCDQGIIVKTHSSFSGSLLGVAY